MAGPLPIKCVVTGPPRSGKSSMLLNLTTGQTADDEKEYTPTVFDNYATSIEHRGLTYELRLSDPGADKELRALECRGADVVLVCFPVTELKQDVKVLANELRVFKEGAKMDSIVLVGTKSDLKNDEATTMKGWNVARELSARIFLECSPTDANHDSVKELFKKVIDISTNKTKTNAFLSELRRTRRQSVRVRKQTTAAAQLDQARENSSHGVNEKGRKAALDSSQDSLASIKGNIKLRDFLQQTDVKSILRTEDYQGLKKVLCDPAEKEKLTTVLSSDASSALFKLKNDTFIATIIDRVDPEVWKIKAKIEGRGENLLHYCINKGYRFSAVALLTTDHPHVTDLVFEKNAAGNTPLMSSLKQKMEAVSHMIWVVMLTRGQTKIEEIGSQLSHILHLCAQNEENELLLKILQGIHAQNPQKVCELVFVKTGEENTLLATCRDEDTLIRILKLLKLKAVEKDFLRCDKKKRNVLNHWARSDFHEAIHHLQIHLSTDTFKKMLMQKSSNGNNPIMVSALHGNKECLDIFLHHICLYQKTFKKEDLAGILHDEDNYGDTLLALVLEHPGRLNSAKQILLDLEMKHHGANAKHENNGSVEDKDAEKGKQDLTECLRKRLKPSVEVQQALNDIDNALPKSNLKKAGIWVRVFLKSLLLPVLLLFLDVFFDAILVNKYSDFDDSNLEDQYNSCRSHETGIGIEQTNRTVNQDYVCETNITSSRPFVCIPLALKANPRFNYSLAFIISPWIFYYIEYCQSKYWQKSAEEMKQCKARHGVCSFVVAWKVFFNLTKGAILILIWPMWSHYQKFRCEVRYLTSHGEGRVKQRKEFIKNNIISSRAQIIEICSEATFQPLLQLYLLLPKMMCVDYHDLLEKDLSTFFTDVPRLQFWAIFTSCMSLSWSYNAYQTSKKTGALDFDSNIWGRLVLLASCVCLITSRLFVFVFLAYCFGDGQFYPMVVIVVFHMLLMTGFHWLTTGTENFNIKTNFVFITNNTLQYCLQVFYQCLLNGISNIYLYNDILALPSEEKNVKKRPTKWKQPMVDSIFVLESLVIIVISLVHVEGLPGSLVIMVVILHILGLLLKVFYYKSLHIWSGVSKNPELPCKLIRNV